MLAVCISIAGLAADKKQEGFRPGPAASYHGHQKQAGLVAAAVSYTTDSEANQAFGKLNPYEEGALPILLVLQNDGKETLDLSRIEVRYVSRDGPKANAIPATEVKFLRPPSRPRVGPGPIPGLNRKKKNPLAAQEIESRGFSAKMLPAGDAASGFFYFAAEHASGSILYVSGVRQAKSGQELFFMEIPIQ
jgi:hypothetical protein